MIQLNLKTWAKGETLKGFPKPQMEMLGGFILVFNHLIKPFSHAINTSNSCHYTPYLFFYTLIVLLGQENLYLSLLETKIPN